MISKLINWLIYTIFFAGILPLALIWVICKITNTDFGYKIICSGIIFFDLTIFADCLKEINEIKKIKDFKLILSIVCIFGIIMTSFLYGIVLLNDYKTDLNLNFNFINNVSNVFTITAIVISICVQVIGGVKNE